jgi:hypothetical protein
VTFLGNELRRSQQRELFLGQAPAHP